MQSHLQSPERTASRFPPKTRCFARRRRDRRRAESGTKPARGLPSGLTSRLSDRMAIRCISLSLITDCTCQLPRGLPPRRRSARRGRPAIREALGGVPRIRLAWEQPRPSGLPEGRVDPIQAVGPGGIPPAWVATAPPPLAALSLSSL